MKSCWRWHVTQQDWQSSSTSWHHHKHYTCKGTFMCSKHCVPTLGWPKYCTHKAKLFQEKKDATHEKHEMDTSGSLGQTNGENVFSETTSCCVCDLWATPWCPLTTAGAYMHPNTYTPRMITEINVPKMYMVYQEYERRLKSSTSIHSANRTTWPLVSATWITSFDLLSWRRKHQLELNPLATALRLQQRVCRLFKFSSGEASVKDSVWRCHCQD